MILPDRRQLRDRTHSPVEMAQVIGIAVAKPVLAAKIFATTRNPSIGAGKVGGVVQRPDGILPRLGIPRTLVVKCIDRRPAGCMAAQAGTRAAAASIRGSLLVDGPGAE